MCPPLEVGFYGKLPSHGDFLRRRISDAFVGAWDSWLHECMASSRSALGERWLDVYLTSPAWRFGCAAGVCGPAPVVGVMAPSVDRVGRYFPLTVVAELPASVCLMTAAAEAELFFDDAERLVIETLEAERVDFDSFDERTTALAGRLDAVGASTRLVLDPGAAAILSDGAQEGWQIPLDVPPRPALAFEQLLTQRLSALYDPLVLWWTEGSSIVEASCLISKGLPPPERFVALLDGLWTQRHWQAIPAHVEMGTSMPGKNVPIEQTTPLRFRSAAASDVGRVREINQDAFLERPEVGLWAVADGLGGHSDGEVASRMVCDALADLVPESSLEDTIDDARRRIEKVNDYLVRVSERSLHAVRSGSTVVAVLARRADCGVLWAGDSRAYRWRSGELERLTRDHSVAESDGPDRDADSHVVTRAVGAEPKLVLDLCRHRVRLGDRFLLCSDGLTHSVPEAQIGRCMGAEAIGDAVEGLIQATLDAGAPDNVTVLVVEACES